MVIFVMRVASSGGDAREEGGLGGKVDPQTEDSPHPYVKITRKYTGRVVWHLSSVCVLQSMNGEERLAGEF